MEARTAALPPVVAGELSLEPSVALTSTAEPEEAETSTPPAQPAPSASLVATEAMDEIIIRIKDKKPVRLVWDEHMNEWVPYLLDEDKRS